MVTFCKMHHFPASIEKLHDMLFWLRKQSKILGFEDSDVKKIELASEEALVNVIRYGYQGFKGDIEIEVHGDQGKKIEIFIKDKGSFFNPLLEDRKVDIEVPLEKRKEGGLGILLIRQYMDEVQYQRLDGWNILMLKKNLK